MYRLLGTLLLLVFLIADGCVTVKPDKKGPAKIEGTAGRTIQSYGLSVDADYEPRLDELIAGYKLLPVSLRNVSLRVIPMDAEKDRWVIIGEKGQKYRAINSLRIKDPLLWRVLPEQIRDSIDYPEVLPINYSVTFDLLFPSRVNLEYFREIRFYSAPLGREFIVAKEY